MSPCRALTVSRSVGFATVDRVLRVRYWYGDGLVREVDTAGRTGQTQ